MSRDRIEGAIDAVEKLAVWFDSMQHGMNGSGFHQGIAAAAAKCRQEAAEYRAQLAALPPEPEPWTARERNEAFAEVVNYHSMENDSDTPDFILGSFLNDCLSAFSRATKSREKWYGREAEEAPDPVQTALADTPPPDAQDEALERAEKALKYARNEMIGMANRAEGDEWLADVAARAEAKINDALAFTELAKEKRNA